MRARITMDYYLKSQTHHNHFTFVHFFMTRIQLIIAGAIGIVLIGVALVIFGPGRKAAAPPNATLEFWGIEDTEDALRPILQNFTEKNPTIRVNYKKRDAEGYEEALLNALAGGKGPDVFILDANLILKHRDKLAPLPQQTLNFFVKNFQAAFADIATADLITDKNEIIGLPLFMDTLVLFYNKDIFNTASIAQAPKTWDDVVAISRQLTQKTSNGDILQSGLAAGTGKNTEHAMEITSALALQNGDPIVKRAPREVVLGTHAFDAFLFYTSFANRQNPNFSWTDLKGNSLDVFAQENAAMAFGFLKDMPQILRKNPHLNLGVAPFPQPKDARTSLTYGTYFFPSVSKLSSKQTAAWQFLLYLATQEGTKEYLDATKRVPVRRDLIAKGAQNAAMDVFYRQALTARNWTIPDEAVIRRLFQETIDGIVSRAIDAKQAVARLQQQINLLIPRTNK